MLLKIIFVLIILQVSPSVVHSRTIDDVVNDFQPVFEEIHNEFSKLEEYAHTNGEPIISDMKQILFNQSSDMKTMLVITQQEVNKKMWDILEQTGMIEHQELVSHCIHASNESKDALREKAPGGERVCVRFAESQINDSNTFAQTLFTQLHNEHYGLEVTREECSKSGNTPFQVQTCLINDLYLFFKPYIVEVTKEVQHRIDVLRNNSKDMQQNLLTCDGYVKEGLSSDIELLVNDFEICVLNAKPINLY